MTSQSNPRRCILILLDGLADRAWPQLGGLTPLAAARTPNLDRLAAAGSCGHFHALAPGAALASEAAHFFMLGYPPAQFPGRAIFEALGQGLEPAPGDLALMAHLAEMEISDRRLILRRKRPPAGAEEIAALAAAVASFESPEGSVRFHPGRGTTGIIMLSGKLSAHITDSDPMLTGRPLLSVRPWAEADQDLAARRTAKLLNEYLLHAHRTLAAHPINAQRAAQGQAPINGVTTQRAGQAAPLEGLRERWGLRAITLCSAPVYAGLFAYLGAASSLLPEGEDPSQDLAGKVELALGHLARYDLVHVHSKAPDEAAHSKDPQAKKEAIESLDQGLAGLLKALESDPDLLVVITGDHATPSGGPLIHAGEPSPLCLAGAGVWRDAVQSLDEVACAAGALGLLRGAELMSMIVNYLDRAKLWGLRDEPRDLPYYPSRRAKPLEIV